MHMYQVLVFGKKKKNKTENETVSELRELFECNLFLIIIIDMKKNS